MSASESVTPRLYADSFAVAGHDAPARSPRIVRYGIVALEVAADYLTSAAGVLAAFWCDAASHTPQLQVLLHQMGSYILAAALLIVLLLEREGAYHGDGSLLRIRETERALRVPVRAAVVLLPFEMLPGTHVPLRTFLLALLFVPTMLMLQKPIFLGLVQMLRWRVRAVSRVVVYGAGDTGRPIVSALLHSLRFGLRPVAVIEDDPPTAASGSHFEMGYRRARSVPVRRGPISSSDLKACRCDLLMVVTHNLSSERRLVAEQAAVRAGVRIAWVSDPEFRVPLRAAPIYLDGLCITSGSSSGQLYPYIKRYVDLIGSSLLLLLLAPLFALIALLVRLDSPGPALFVQERVGRNGSVFSMYKFRSMYIDAPRYQRSPATSRDPRITRMGRFLRRSSFDELPQLFNVFLGKMSLVGPRPEMPFIVQNYSAEQRQRLQVVPGITGLWQLSADRAFPIHEAVQYDLYYIRNRGVFMDLAILVHTLLFAMRGGI